MANFRPISIQRWLIFEWIKAFHTTKPVNFQTLFHSTKRSINFVLKRILLHAPNPFHLPFNVDQQKMNRVYREIKYEIIQHPCERLIIMVLHFWYVKPDLLSHLTSLRWYRYDYNSNYRNKSRTESLIEILEKKFKSQW